MEDKRSLIMSDVEMRPLWHKEPCWTCGEEGFATRTEYKPVTEPYICESCEMYERGYKDGVEHTKADAAKPKVDVMARREFALSYIDNEGPVKAEMNALIAVFDAAHLWKSNPKSSSAQCDLRKAVDAYWEG